MTSIRMTSGRCGALARSSIASSASIALSTYTNEVEGWGSQHVHTNGDGDLNMFTQMLLPAIVGVPQLHFECYSIHPALSRMSALVHVTLHIILYINAPECM